MQRLGFLGEEGAPGAVRHEDREEALSVDAVRQVVGVVELLELEEGRTRGRADDSGEGVDLFAGIAEDNVVGELLVCGEESEEAEARSGARRRTVLLQELDQQRLKWLRSSRKHGAPGTIWHEDRQQAGDVLLLLGAVAMRDAVLAS